MRMADLAVAKRSCIRGLRAESDVDIGGNGADGNVERSYCEVMGVVAWLALVELRLGLRECGSDSDASGVTADGIRCSLNGMPNSALWRLTGEDAFSSTPPSNFASCAAASSASSLVCQ